MKTREIKNLRTSKTEKQIKDELMALKSKRNVQLAATDWTQLPDVPLINVSEFSSWRQELRNLSIDSTKDYSKLQELISRKPTPVKGDIVEPEQEDSPVVETELQYPEINLSDLELRDEITLSTRDEAEKTLSKLLTQEKSQELLEADSSSYPMFRLLQEELIEYSMGDSPPKFLEKYMIGIRLNPNVEKDVEKAAKICRDYFTKINDIFLGFEIKIRSVYTMSDSELQEDLKERGYRYRPTD